MGTFFTHLSGVGFKPRKLKWGSGLKSGNNGLKFIKARFVVESSAFFTEWVLDFDCPETAASAHSYHRSPIICIIALRPSHFPFQFSHVLCWLQDFDLLFPHHSRKIIFVVCSRMLESQGAFQKSFSDHWTGDFGLSLVDKIDFIFWNDRNSVRCADHLFYPPHCLKFSLLFFQLKSFWFVFSVVYKIYFRF